MATVWGSDWFTYDIPDSLRRGIFSKAVVSDTGYGFENWLLGTAVRDPGRHGKQSFPTGPTRRELERHRSLFGPDCVYIPKETRSASELRAVGLSVREIAHTLGIPERRVRVQLRLDASRQVAPTAEQSDGVAA